jgi:hypothetical protein
MIMSVPGGAVARSYGLRGPRCRTVRAVVRSALSYGPRLVGPGDGIGCLARGQHLRAAEPADFHYPHDRHFLGSVIGCLR